jgi:hypothetical protein
MANYFNLSTVNNEGRVTQVVGVIEIEDESSNPSS